MEKKVWWEQGYWVIEIYNDDGELLLRMGTTLQPTEELLAQAEEEAIRQQELRKMLTMLPELGEEFQGVGNPQPDMAGN